jgi:hypothetical protein
MYPVEIMGINNDVLQQFENHIEHQLNKSVKFYNELITNCCKRYESIKSLDLGVYKSHGFRVPTGDQ